jgi:Asp/Glu/hydantoin racemase
MQQRILVINPNSTEAVTGHMSAACDAFRLPGAPQIICETLHSGPPGIETEEQIDAVSGLLLDWLDGAPERRRAQAIVIGCFADPGLGALRAAFRRPVIGIGAASYALAASIVERFATIAVVAGALARHRRKARAMGLEHRFAASLSIDLGVAGLADQALTWSRLVDRGTRLRDEHGAEALILGCAGLANHRQRLEQELGIPVIEPTQAAVGAAMTLLLAARPAVAGRQPHAA